MVHLALFVPLASIPLKVRLAWLVRLASIPLGVLRIHLELLSLQESARVPEEQQVWVRALEPQRVVGSGRRSPQIWVVLSVWLQLVQLLGAELVLLPVSLVQKSAFLRQKEQQAKSVLGFLLGMGWEMVLTVVMGLVLLWSCS